MAKKKVSHSNGQDNKPSKTKPDSVVKPTPTMDSDSTEKLDSLKTLNQMLLKEAVERRQQVDSLTQSNVSLESDLTRSISEKDSLKSDLIHLNEMADKLVLEKSVMSVFIAVQMSRNDVLVDNTIVGLENDVKELKSVVDEKESEIGVLNCKMSEIESALADEKAVSVRVSVEKDALKSRAELLVKESVALKKSLRELEVKKREMEQEIGDLRVAYDGVVKEKVGADKRIVEAVKENDSFKKELVELNKAIGETRERLNETVREKEMVEGERDGEVVKRVELEKVVSGLNETVAGLKKEAVVMRVSIAELESKCGDSEEKQKGMQAEIERLVGEKKLSEKRVEGLIGEKNVVEKILSEAIDELEKERRKVKDLVNEKSVLVEARGNLENEVVSLQNQVTEFRGVVSKLEKSGSVKEEKILSLEAVVGSCKRKLEQVGVERDEIAVCLGKEKQNALRLKDHIDSMEKRVAELLEVARVAKTKYDALSTQKTKLNGECENLKKEIASLETTLTEARNELGVMKGKFESADAKSEMVLNMLKDTAAFCLTDELSTSKQVNGEESVTEFEMIKKAFKSKEARIDGMKKQLEFLQTTVDEVNKKKSFWTVLSSATTLLAAVSLAYVARGAGR